MLKTFEVLKQFVCRAGVWAVL